MVRIVARDGGFGSGSGRGMEVVLAKGTPAWRAVFCVVSLSWNYTLTMAAGCRQRSAPANKHFAEGGNCRHGIERPQKRPNTTVLDATSVVSTGARPQHL